MSELNYRLAEASDQPILEAWDALPHVAANIPDDAWDWAEGLRQRPHWREQWIAELYGRPIGFMQVIDPAEEESGYWQPIGPGHRAIDIWIGPEDALGQGHGSAMMAWMLRRCFAASDVHTVLIDPLESNVRAHRFYQRLGFSPIGRRRLEGLDCLIHALDRTEAIRRKYASASA